MVLGECRSSKRSSTLARHSYSPRLMSAVTTGAPTQNLPSFPSSFRHCEVMPVLAGRAEMRARLWLVARLALRGSPLAQAHHYDDERKSSARLAARTILELANHARGN